MNKIAICGLGLIGRKRLQALRNLGWHPSQIIVYDPNIPDGNFENFTLAKSIDWVLTNQIDLAIVATPHNIAPQIVKKFLDAGVRVLMEKPMGRNIEEALALHFHDNSRNLSVGFNYRFMPSIQKAKSILENGELGTIHTVRMDLGHGGAPEDRNSWKLNPESAGGGVTLDPGIHLLDLIGFLFNVQPSEIQFIGANSWKGFWNTGIEESINVIGGFKETLLNLSISIVAWRTRFEIEVIGTDGYMKLTGRGRTDGPQILTKGRRWGWLKGESQSDSETVMKLATTDESLAIELESWLNRNSINANSQDGLNAELLRTRILETLQK